MVSLRDYRERIVSVKSTRKITSAMKMVAASKLRKAQDQAEASQPYAEAMGDMMSRLAADVQVTPSSPKLLIGTGKDDVHLLVVIAADRGLCGGFNANLVRRAQQQIRELQGNGKTVKLICVGRKVRDGLMRTHRDKIYESFVNLSGKKNSISFTEADKITQCILDGFDIGDFDTCTLIYNEFASVLSQKPEIRQLIPYSMGAIEPEAANDDVFSTHDNGEEEKAIQVSYEFEPSQDLLFAQLLPKNLSVQIYRALLDSAAGEQAARMTAMDNATRNAGDLIKDLTLQYNRARQAFITKELIEIISGAEAV